MARAKFSPLFVLCVLPFVLVAALVSPLINFVLRYRLKRRPPVGISTHGEVLARKRSQTLYSDDYGQIVADRWHKERNYFIKTVLIPSLPILYRGAKIQDILEDQIEAHINSLPYSQAFSPSINPVEYEHYCAEIMRQAGWQAKVTKTSGDQGADVIAEASGRRVVLQCKLYNHAVSNKAVQEISAARLHYKGDFAAVGTNLSYTDSAKRLANTNNISLLHHDDLSAWASSLYVSPVMLSQ
jgi:HJR/Mrr/RecB family endonuclease